MNASWRNRWIDAIMGETIDLQGFEKGQVCEGIYYLMDRGTVRDRETTQLLHPRSVEAEINTPEVEMP